MKFTFTLIFALNFYLALASGLNSSLASSNKFLALFTDSSDVVKQKVLLSFRFAYFPEIL